MAWARAIRIKVRTRGYSALGPDLPDPKSARAHDKRSINRTTAVLLLRSSDFLCSLSTRQQLLGTFDCRKRHDKNSAENHSSPQSPCLTLTFRNFPNPTRREMARGNQRDKAREKNQKESAAQVRNSIPYFMSDVERAWLMMNTEKEEHGT